jgi:hypothetical protein
LALDDTQHLTDRPLYSPRLRPPRLIGDSGCFDVSLDDAAAQGHCGFRCLDFHGIGGMALVV